MQCDVAGLVCIGALLHDGARIRHRSVPTRGSIPDDRVGMVMYVIVVGSDGTREQGKHDHGKQGGSKQHGEFLGGVSAD